MDVLLANPRGFCAGVDRAIAIVLQALAEVRRADLRAPRGRPQQVRRRRPARQGCDLRRGAGRSSSGSTVVFSAHGVSKAVRAEADARGLRVFDATCPLVTKVHVEIAKMRERGLEIVMIGHSGPPGSRGNDGPVRRRRLPRRNRRRRGHAWTCAIPSILRTSRRRRCRSTMPPGSSLRSKSAFPESSARRRTTSATRRRTGRMP